MLLATASGRLLRFRASSGVLLKHSVLDNFHTWPDPMSQQTIEEFLDEINYFQHPRNFLNVGLQHRPSSTLKNKTPHQKVTPPPSKWAAQLDKQEPIEDEKLDDVFELLSHETVVPQLDYDDVLMTGQQVIGLATSQGIYRDLFQSYKVNRDDIAFTQAQAERQNKFVPFYWITDLPFSRVDRHPKQLEPTKFFQPLVRISAKFIHQAHDNKTDEYLYAHPSYYGNHIPACDALLKPSIALDCHLLSAHLSHSLTNQSDGMRKQEKDFDNWTPGSVQVVNLSSLSNAKIELFYSLLLLNLDYLHTDDHCNLHWLAANIKASQQDNAAYDELCDYLPVHGIRGFGYSRYVFVLLQHEAPITSQKVESFSLESRKFNLNSFIQEHQSKNIVPIGLSWFQTTWDESSNSVFHNYLNIKAPVYEYVQPIRSQRPATGYPGRVPFNIYLDHYRHKKDINQQVLLERLKQVNPFDYTDQYEVPKVPPSIHQDENIPSWMKTVMFKKKNKIGYWRGLRPASAILPLNNNADLDYPLRPVESAEKNPPGFPNEYPGKPRKKLLKEMPTSKPVTEFSNVYIQEDHEIHLEKALKMMKEANFKKQTETQTKDDDTTTSSP